MGIDLFKIQTYIRRNIDIGTLNRGKKFQCILVIWGKFYEDV
jgi:hypothetical protein